MFTPSGSESSSPSKGSPEKIKSAEEIRAEKLTKAHENAQRAYFQMLRYIFKHEEMSPRVWCVSISSHPKLEYTNKTRFCRMMKYETLSGPIFVFAEHTEPVTSYSLRLLSGHNDLFVGMVAPESATVTLAQLLDPTPSHYIWPRIVASNRLFPDDTYMLALQYDQTHTACFSKKVFDAIAPKHFPLHLGPLGSVDFGRLSSSAWEDMDQDEWKKTVVRRLEVLEDTQASALDSIKLQRRANRSKYDLTNEVLKGQIQSMTEMRQRVGPLHESVVRLSLASARDLEWGKSKTIYGLSDIFSFVAGGLNATTAQKNTATNRLYTKLLKGFRTWLYNIEDLKLNEINIDNVTRPLTFVLM